MDEKHSDHLINHDYIYKKRSKGEKYIVLYGNTSTYSEDALDLQYILNSMFDNGYRLSHYGIKPHSNNALEIVFEKID